MKFVENITEIVESIVFFSWLTKSANEQFSVGLMVFSWSADPLIRQRKNTFLL
jgi:hypothetical protein